MDPFVNELGQLVDPLSIGLTVETYAHAAVLVGPCKSELNEITRFWPWQTGLQTKFQLIGL